MSFLLLLLTYISLLFILNNMKKLAFLLLLTFFIFNFSSANAQSGQIKKSQSELCSYGNSQPGHSGHFKKDKPKFGAGVKAGLNYSNQYITGGSGSVDFKSIIGINAGAYCNYFFMDFLAIQPELMVSGKGSHWTNQYYDAQYNLTYIDFPVLIRFQPVPLINIQAGPQISYLLIANQKDIGTNLKTNVTGNFYQLDFGLAFGVEANLPYKVNLTVRYVLGLNTATTGTLYTETWNNKYFQVSLGYRILGR
jgi:hypothetical protein